MRRPDLLFLVVIWLFFSAFLYFIAIAAIAAPARLARATPTSAGDDRLPGLLAGRLRATDFYLGGDSGTNMRSGPTNGVRSDYGRHWQASRHRPANTVESRE
jgi:hypothetical protein